MTKPLRVALFSLPAFAVACDEGDGEPDRFEAQAAELAAYVGIEEYELVVEDEDESEGEPEANASFDPSLDLAVEPDVAEAKCHLEGWIGHTPICKVCTINLWFGCFESTDCGGGSSISQC